MWRIRVVREIWGGIRIGEGVFRGGGVKRKTWGRSGEKVWEGERRGLRRIGWGIGRNVWIGVGRDLGCR